MTLNKIVLKYDASTKNAGPIHVEPSLLQVRLA